MESHYIVDGDVMPETEFVTIGKIVKPFGVRGQVRVLSLTDVPGRLENLDEVRIETASGESLVTKVSDVHSDGRSYLFRFQAFSSPEEVAAFRGAWLKVPLNTVPPAPEGHHYQFELIGLTVKEESGKVLGVLEEVIETPAQHLFVIRGQDGELLLPAFKKWIQKVDIPGQEMIVFPKEEWSGDYAV
ncbi:ribosome maturation factor RimM [Candidatus Nitronereus thalassa]|uniref:Ribosome maturation factor RimM n=1 Tax=Candidatus Nitronereus thalassa TaxID=3020898 RepID=A0ABU3K3C5_9BACT|nr:ribosome maturation factor RimM [Candidatus Nitronereus thalassa]MDT7040900.1 ribosome maturation factor RimM [Candidatus Nitronereus thalassa]